MADLGPSCVLVGGLDPKKKQAATELFGGNCAGITEKDLVVQQKHKMFEDGVVRVHNNLLSGPLPTRHKVLFSGRPFSDQLEDSSMVLLAMLMFV